MPEFDDQRSHLQRSSVAPQSPRTAEAIPGKVTRTEQLALGWSSGAPASTTAPAPVQAKGALQGDGAQRWASHGLGGATAELPHRATIQQLFGHHDVSGVKAAVGGPAAEASTALGARAYASGDVVAFAQAPDLHLATHEAAHVVQQRSGVRLSDGLGRAGDCYEQHADAVADLVVRGASAEALLDTMAHRGSGGGPAVQRSEDSATATTTNATGAPSASAPAPTGPSRNVAGPGGYTYQQFADGTIKVLAGPTSVGKVLPPQDPKNQAITAQIGPFVPASAPAAPAAPDAAAPSGETGVTGAVDAVVGAVTGAVDAVAGAVTDTAGAVVDGVGTLVDGLAGVIGVGGTTAAPGAADTGAATAPAAPTAPAVVPVDPANHQSRASFVGPMVGENARTTQILDTIWPYFHQGDQAIAGYMTDVQLIWKVNFHWDEILWVCDKVGKMDVSEDCKTQLKALASGLMAFTPDPGKGAYLPPSTPGNPVDKTTPQAFDARYQAVKDAKPRLQAILDAAGIFAKYPKTSEPGRSFQNACDFLKPPSTSKHGEGYALDIQGDENRILAAASKVGMTGKAKEAYTHVEFANGAHAPGVAAAPTAKPGAKPAT